MEIPAQKYGARGGTATSEMPPPRSSPNRLLRALMQLVIEPACNFTRPVPRDFTRSFHAFYPAPLAFRLRLPQ